MVTSFKVMVPTATNRDIGTGKFDWYPYFILNKNIGGWDLNVNIGVSFFGQYGDERLKNEVIYDFSAQHAITEKLGFIGEIFGNTRAVATERSTFAGAVALEYEFNKNFNVFVSVGYDTDKTFSVRPGFNIPF